MQLEPNQPIYEIVELNEQYSYIRYKYSGEKFIRTVTRASNRSMFFRLWKQFHGIKKEDVLSDAQLFSKVYPLLSKVKNGSYELNCSLMESGFDNDKILESLKELSKRGYLIQLSIK